MGKWKKLTMRANGGVLSYYEYQCAGRGQLFCTVCTPRNVSSLIGTETKRLKRFGGLWYFLRPYLRNNKKMGYHKAFFISLQYTLHQNTISHRIVYTSFCLTYQYNQMHFAYRLSLQWFLIFLISPKKHGFIHGVLSIFNDEIYGFRPILAFTICSKYHSRIHAFVR